MKIRILILTTLLLAASSFKSTHSMQQRKPVAQQENKICSRCGLANPPKQDLCVICAMPLLASPAPGAAHVDLGARDDESEKKEYAQAPAQGKQFLAKDFFKEIVGMTEEDFRDTYNWTWNKQTHKDARLGALADVDTLAKWETWKRNWIQEYQPEPGIFPRQAIFAGVPKYQTLGQINQQIAQTSINPRKNRTQFNILLHDSRNPQATEITHLQADPQNKHAVFQLASTFFGPLEGGMINPEKLITGMLDMPVQGEWASVSAAGATIFRKYFMTTDSYINRRSQLSAVPGEVYLLHNIAHKAPVTMDLRHRHTDRYVDLETLKRYKYDPKDMQQIGIFSHENIYTTSECIANQGEKGNATLLSIPLSNNQLITQTFSAAYDLKNYLNRRENYPQVIDFAKMVLAAMYEGAIKHAVLEGNKKIFLTLVGGGAFLNDIRWIAEILEKPELTDFIKSSGIEVNIIFRTDKKRDLPVRTAENDIEFITRMYRLADIINGTNTADQTLATPSMQNYFDNIEQTYGAIRGARSARSRHAGGVPAAGAPAPGLKPRGKSRSPQRRAPSPVQQQQSAQLQPRLFPQPQLQPIIPQQQAAAQPQIRPSLQPQQQQHQFPPQRAAAQPFFPQHAAALPARAQQQPELVHQEILGTGKNYKLGWLWNEKIGDWALINYGNKDKPEMYPDGSKNFFFVSPNIPSEPVPKNRNGEQLYYWKSSNQLPLPKQFSNKVNWVIVEPLPGSGRPYIYSTAKNIYVPAVRSPRTNAYIPAE